MSFVKSKITGNIYKYENDTYTEVPKNNSNQMYIEFVNWLSQNNTVETFEGTQEEISAKQQEEKLLEVRKFMQKKLQDGFEFFENLDLRITVDLSAMKRNVLFPKLSEIDSLLYPPLNKIKTGDFASALYLFSNQTPPTDAFVLQYYNEALTFCQTYYDTNYPK